MWKSLRYPALAIGLAAAAGLAALLVTSRRPVLSPETLLAAYDEQRDTGGLTIRYPLDGTFFPPELPPPRFHWEDEHAEADVWLVTLSFHGGGAPIHVLTHRPEWTPDDARWEGTKLRTRGTDARVTVLGASQARPGKVLSAASITFRTSVDEVGAPIFYREVNLPFVEAVKDPSNIRWRFGTIGSKTSPPVVLEKLPVCGNCHSFSADGSVLGMDVDYANDKGSYAIAPVERETLLTRERIITWSDFAREDGQQTFGLLSQVSPDGRYVLSTVKDRSVFVPKPGLEFSQLFFPVVGILAWHHRADRTFHALPGADDPRFVQSNPSWSPDGKHVVFARSEAHPLEVSEGKVLLTPEECREFLKDGKTFQFDLVRIPFDEGRGGTPEPLAGASDNGMSNYFPKHSPDGRWIVFNKAASFMLLQPDSELYIVPAEGGEARRMRCNTPRMNSWHSWSPNGRWLVFSSKANGPYTQLWLTHVDEEGRDTPPVLLDRFTTKDGAANIPEFVNTRPDALAKIREAFVDDQSFLRAGFQFLKSEDHLRAAQAFRKAVQHNPKSVKAHVRLGRSLMALGFAKKDRARLEEAAVHFENALELNPASAETHNNLGIVQQASGRVAESLVHFQEALRLDPGATERHKTLNNLGSALRMLGRLDEAAARLEEALGLVPDYAEAHDNLGVVLEKQGKLDEAVSHHREALRLEPDLASAHINLAVALGRLGKPDRALHHHREALRLQPERPEAHNDLGAMLARMGRVEEAVAHYRQALRVRPGYVDAHNNLALALASQGKLAQAVRHYRIALRHAPRHPETHNNLGIALAMQGRLPEAISHFGKALEVRPDYVEARGNLELARRKLRGARPPR